MPHGLDVVAVDNLSNSYEALRIRSHGSNGGALTLP
jgi:hypothetical protein